MGWIKDVGDWFEDTYNDVEDWAKDAYNDVTGVTAANIEADAAAEASGIESDAQLEAARIQAEAAQAAIDEQKRQFDAMQELMKPWVKQGEDALAGLDQYEDAGSDALAQQRALLGLDGPDAQRAAMEAISNSPELAGLYTQGENALMQSGAATGGLRGGNTQAALAQFRPQMLSELINQKYLKLGGIIDMGVGVTTNRAALAQASAAGLAAGGLESASSIADLLMRQGEAEAGGVTGSAAAQAGGVLAQGKYDAQANYNAWQPVRTGAQLAAMYALGAF